MAITYAETKEGIVEYIVHGRGKRKRQNQQYLELFRRFLKRQTIYDWYTANFQRRNNYCKTDPDATFMHMKDDHMRNARLKPGYNVQIGVASEYIVLADIFCFRKKRLHKSHKIRKESTRRKILFGFLYR